MNPDDFRIPRNLYFPYSPEELVRHGYRNKSPIENKPVDIMRRYPSAWDIEMCVKE